MRYAKINNGVVDQYPVYPTDVALEKGKTVSFRAGILSDALMFEFGYMPVTETPQPVHDPITQCVREIAPKLINGHYEQDYAVVALDAATIAANITTAKAAKWVAIKSSRDARKDGGVLIGTQWFHTDTDSRVQQLALVLMGASVPAVAWKTMDGTFAAMSQTLAGQIFAAVAALDMALFANAEAHRAAVESSANPAAYDITTGWPAHYPI